MKSIYIDYNATTPLKPEVYETMVPYLKEHFGNPSSIHWAGRSAKSAIMMAREQVGKLFHVEPTAILFTSGGTEANNCALKGAYHSLKSRGNHIITTRVEHKSVLDTCEYLKKEGAEITTLSVNLEGEINLQELENALRPQTILISIQAANNETGVLMPIQKISEIAKQHHILFHSDAVQWAGKKELFLDEIPIDLVSVSSHKIYGPKGAGALILRKGLKLEALLHGGNQERKRRGGTENVPAIVGFGKASELISDPTEKERLSQLRDRLEEGIVAHIPEAMVNGKGAERILNTLNVSFSGVEGEGILLNLDLKGIAASSGSACSSGSLDPSHVLLAMGRSEELALSSIRFSLGYQNTAEDIDTVIKELPLIILNLREMNKSCS